MASSDSLRQRVGKMLRKLAKLYPEAHCTLNHDNPLQLLIATILSAQSTDARVNLVTPALFARYQDAQDFAGAEVEELQRLIQSLGFYRTKAKNIIACCQLLVNKHQGQVPRTLSELVELPGVGRKTANVLLGEVFATPGITVDTHVGRLSRRLGLTAERAPSKIERDLMKLIPQAEWTTFSHQMIFHGRRVCHSRRPACDDCGLRPLCPQNGVTVKKS